MKSTNTFICLFFLLSLCFTFFLGYIIRHDYSDSRREMCKKMEVIFDEAIEEDARIWKTKLGIITHEVPAHDSCLIPSNERIMHACQKIIIEGSPNRHSLDSLFRLKIAEQKIQARCAVRCISQFGVINSSSDSLFYEKSVQLPPVIYRPRVDSWKNRVELQGYVQVSGLFILKQISSLWLLLLLWIVGNGVLWGIYVLLTVYRKKMLSENKTIEIRTVVTEKIVEKIVPVQASKQRGLFPPDFIFDKHIGILSYKGTTVELNKQSLSLFSFLIDNMRQSVVTYAEISGYMYRNNKPDEKMKKRIYTAIARLREKIEPFPFIRLEALGGMGYSLRIDISE